MAQPPIPVVVNRSGGTAASLGDALGERLDAAFTEAGVPVEIHLVEADAIGRVVEGLAGVPLVVVGGGDGTLGQAAALLAGAGSAMGILPLGTRNHLALQLGIPPELVKAARVIAQGHRVRIDLARAGDRVFVNNASVGLYSALVRKRESFPGPKWVSNLRAAWHVLHHIRIRPLRLVIDGVSKSIATPLLFIGNNRYVLDGGKVGARASMSEGVLSFYAVSASSAPQLLAMALRTLAGRADAERDFVALEEGCNARIEGVGALDVAFDGEVERMALPIDLAILPQALEVVAPPRIVA